MSERVFVLGAGRVGRGLASALRAAGIAITGVHGRVAGEGATSHGALPDAMSDANVVIVAVRDAQLDEAMHSLVEASGRRPPLLARAATVLHTSAASDPPASAELRARGHACGTFHPLMAFADRTHAGANLKDSWFGIAGDGAACADARRLAARLGARTVNIPPGAGAAYHAAAVFASNFTVVLAIIAERLLAEAGIASSPARQVTQSLMRGAMANLEDAAEPAAALTGPVLRGDVDTVRAHLAALRSDPAAERAYRALAAAALDVARSRGLGDRAADELRELLTR